MHSNLLHELIWILSDVKPNSAKFDSAITDLADIVFTSKDYDEILSELEDIYIHEGYCREIMICKARVSLLGALLAHSTAWISKTWRHSLNS